MARKEYSGVGPSGATYRWRKLTTPEWFSVIKAMPTISVGEGKVEEKIDAEYWDKKLDYYRQVVKLGCMDPMDAFDEMEHVDTSWLVERITEISGLAGDKADQAESFREGQ